VLKFEIRDRDRIRQRKNSKADHSARKINLTHRVINDRRLRPLRSMISSTLEVRAMQRERDRAGQTIT
jgi:hypothetical protein